MPAAAAVTSANEQARHSNGVYGTVLRMSRAPSVGRYHFLVPEVACARTQCTTSPLPPDPHVPVPARVDLPVILPPRFFSSIILLAWKGRAGVGGGTAAVAGKPRHGR
ncbi:uncharacterized protein UV8b_00034 [Ustilaginoidea virens]|uniref:Uncharacterized protein n=1 Tax=Ustilaginoidea virens TaxID=1159556 RepID=A0A8E5HI18_USTVR|nr:uncharacterized protein UV8b_00034 [Ustilaginoidea virens]QUC15793.1 hypothetical protein UV8b_00034 [Ustilaginoidea virens]